MSKQAFLFLYFSFVFMLGASSAVAQTCAAPPVGLTDFYTGDNSANDFVGANHGTLANGVASGETYIFEVRHKRFQFTPQVVSVSEDLTELNFTAQ